MFFVGVENVKISKDHVSFNLTRIFNMNVIRVRVHRHDFLLQRIRIVRQIDAVTKRFAHLGIAVKSRQPSAAFLRENSFRFNQDFAVDRIKAAHDFSCLFKHRLLIIANRNIFGFKRGNVCCLTDRVSKEAGRNRTFKILLLNFCLNGRIALKTRYSHQIEVIQIKFCKRRNLRLNENRRFLRIKSGGKIIKRNLNQRIFDFFRVASIVGQGLLIGNHDVRSVFSRILHLNAVLKRADVMTDVKFSRWTVARQNNIVFHYETSFPSSVYAKKPALIQKE